MANKVLIVDDDDAVLTMLYKVIKSNGIDADTCSSGEAALSAITKENYDLAGGEKQLHYMEGDNHHLDLRFQEAGGLVKRWLKENI